MSVQPIKLKMLLANCLVKETTVFSFCFHFWVFRYIAEALDGTTYPKSRPGRSAALLISFVEFKRRVKQILNRLNKDKTPFTELTYPWVILLVWGLFFARANDDVVPINSSFAIWKLHFPVFLKSFLISSLR